MAYVIERNIAVPEPTFVGREKSANRIELEETIKTMRVGDSFAMSRKDALSLKVNDIAIAMGRKVTVRMNGDSARVWLISDNYTPPKKKAAAEAQTTLNV